MSNTVKLPICPKCGAPIPIEAPQGLCPKCVLLGAATATEQGVPATATSEIPSIERIAAAFPQLEILELIGRGGMGFVFKARQPHLDRFVALKLLPDKLAKDPQFAERFNREGRVLAKLNHPNITSVFDFGHASAGAPVFDSASGAALSERAGSETGVPSTQPKTHNQKPGTSDGGFYYLTMEYVDGVNLRQAMRAGRFSPAEALSIVPKVCEALQYAHEQGILHRDIKPENILLDAKGRVKIADFGIAKLVGEDQPNITLTNTGAALGTPHYMAPEQLEKPGTVDHRADIYSLGVVFYEMLTGELPIGRFAAPSSKTPVNSTVDDVVFRTLEKDRERRFQSAGEMRTEVEHLTESGFGGALSETDGGETQRAVLQEAVSLVENPARALLAAGVLSWAASTAAIIWMSLGGFWQQSLNTRPELVLIVMPLFALSSVIIAGALKMRKLEAHPLAVAASVLAMLTSLGSIVGLPAGLWAFRTLRRPNIRAAFALQRQNARSPLPPGPPPVSRNALLGAASTIVSLPFPVVAIAMLLSHQGDMGLTGYWITIISACGFGVAGTILGCLGVCSIMESRGRLQGLGMGWFAAATWPLLVVVGIPLSIPWFSLAERSGRSEARPAAATDKTVEAEPMIQFTFTTVELREENGARWLAMDFVQQVRGDCEHTFRYDARVPSFTAQTRKDSHLSNAQAGFAPVLHQRILWKLPDSLPENDAFALRDLVAKQWIGKSVAIEPGDERVLFKTLVPDGGTLATAVGVKLKSDDNLSSTSRRIQFAGPDQHGLYLYLHTDSELRNGDYLVTLLKHPDGRVDETPARSYAIRQNGKAVTTKSLSWPMARFESNRVADVAAKIREALDGTVVSVKPREPLEIFTATNDRSGVIQGSIELRTVTNGKAGVSLSVLSTHTWPQMLIAYLKVSGSFGYPLQGVGLYGSGAEVDTHTPIGWDGAGNSSCRWNLPPGFAKADADEIARQLEAIKNSAPNGLHIEPGQRVPVFALTNQAGTVFRGYFELPVGNVAK